MRVKNTTGNKISINHPSYQEFSPGEEVEVTKEVGENLLATGQFKETQRTSKKHTED